MREDVRIRLACPTSSVVTMVTTGMRLQLSLFLLGHDVIAKWQRKKEVCIIIVQLAMHFNAWCE